MALAFASGTLAWKDAGHDWRMIGYDSEDNRTQRFERRIGVHNVSHLARKWVASTAGDVSATPAVEGPLNPCSKHATVWLFF